MPFRSARGQNSRRMVSIYCASTTGGMWYAVANLIVGRVVTTIIGLGALWNALTSLMSIVHALQRGAAPHRILYLQLMLSGLGLAMMGILYARRGRGPIVFWCELSDRIVVGRLGAPAEYGWSQVVGFDYEGVGNHTRVAVARAPFPVDGRRVLVIALSSGTEFRVKVRHDEDAALKHFATRLEKERSHHQGR